MTSNLEKLGNRIEIRVPADEEGYLGRECPNKECLGYFKVLPGTGLKGTPPCHCPYCGHVGDHNTFWTPDQIEYAKSIALKKITDAFRQDLKALEFDHKPKGGFGIGISMKLKPGSPVPIRRFREKNLETKVTCDKCTLQFSIYGVFGWCPDCGARNSLQILTKNLELARKQLGLASNVDADLGEHLIGDALENVVAAFDGFGREICSQKGQDIAFQNIEGAKRRVQQAFGFDFADGLSESDLALINRLFQKRHVLSHKMGVMDDEYVKKSGDSAAVSGRRIRITSEEVASAIKLVGSLGQRLFDQIHGV